jgi:hypothetical protein
MFNEADVSPLYRYPSVTILKYHSESHCSNWWYQNGPADQTSGQMVRYFRENTSPSATTTREHKNIKMAQK